MPGSPIPASPAPIVVAETAPATLQLRRMLDGTWPLSTAQTLSHARQAVNGDTPLILCGCHFDEGRMYDLLRWVRGQQPLRHIPFLTIRVLEGELDDAMYESVKIATGALGGNGFVDLLRWERRYGPQAAGQRFAEHVKAMALGAPGHLDSL
ncbi:hypothetical protein [Ramlibacter humi]|uniref:Uncharacterized protein n=1 Tax=Ramlibacter humi TaxID=2530451 RepID=A0A4Z0CAJ6_9BURK|nr:hypothetical protein [Ramlibacter humi]TFZ07922.1 hypothetical protein EZ216_01795 [Ramlibacter humi]